ncbi:partial CAI-1 autoinducer sensor kinase/phosphatase CqsS, partial [Rhodocyclaceae bacterium]
RHLPRQAETDQSAAATQFSGRVLVVEDNRTNRKVVEAMLARHGATVLMAEDGQQGLAAVTQGSPVDLVLMDLQMPVLDGYAATERIRDWERDNGRAAVPIVALTADAFEEDRRRCEAVGMDDFLTKPISAEALLAILRRWLKGAA